LLLSLLPLAAKNKKHQHRLRPQLLPQHRHQSQPLLPHLLLMPLPLLPRLLLQLQLLTLRCRKSKYLTSVKKPPQGGFFMLVYVDVN
jgi:hypothetical protein